MAGTGVFVGREGELSRLRSALGERARLVLVVGDAGIGKTRFVGEGLARAAAGGMSVISGGCLPLAEKLPLLPVADALDGLSRLDGGALFETALAAAPDYVRPEVARLLPRLATAEPVATGQVEGWRHDRLFAAVAELLDGVARRSAVALLIEDVHWADPATLDFLTYLVRVGRGDAVTVVVTCRSDEVPLDAGVADWLTHVRRDATVEEIRLSPLSPGEVTKQVTGLVGAPPPAGLVEEVYARAEGHPFFTEQLVAAAVTDSGQLARPLALPARLAELLVARAAGCGTDGRAVLAVLSMAGRPLSVRFLGEVTGLGPETVRTAVRELTAARLLAAAADEGHRPRHALLGEAVAAELLPDERVALHERIAQALEATRDDTLAAEVAGHWAAAGRAAEELKARLAAAEAAEHVFAYADAAAHWQRAIELCQADPSADLGDGLDLPHLYIRVADALDASGDGVRAGVVAEEAYQRFADHTDRATAAQVHLRAAEYRDLFDSPAAGLRLIMEALQLFEGTAPSAEHARAWHFYAVLLDTDGRHFEERVAALHRALEIAEAAGAPTLKASILSELARRVVDRGEVEEGFRLVAQARNEPGVSRDPAAIGLLASTETEALLQLGKLEAATRVALRDVDLLRQLGCGNNFDVTILLSNAAEGLLLRGRTAEAAALIDPQTPGSIDRYNAWLHMSRASIDLRGPGRTRASPPRRRCRPNGARRGRRTDAPFTEHPFVATIPAARATWDAEHSRAAGASDPAAWSAAAERWEALDYRHRAGYARWRQAEALLATPNGKGAAAAVLATAAGLAVEHGPLTTAIQDLARRARIDLDAAAPQVHPDEPSTARAFGLTERELDVLRLLGQGKTNPEIAAALFISPRTAGVHVTNILRKLDAPTRVQAATIAERAGLLHSGQTDTPLAHT